MPIRIPRLFIDKLSLTVPVAAERIALVSDRISVANETWPLVVELDSRVARYRHHFKLLIPGEDAIHVFAEPHRQTDNFLKIEYSPNNVGADGARMLAVYLRFVLGSSFVEDFYSGNVNRFHVGFDIHRIPLEDLLIVHDRSAKSAIIRGKTSEVETLIFSYRGTHQLVVYDKRRERDERGRGGETSISWVRFEYQYNKGDYCLDGIWRQLRNPFNRFTVRRFEAPNGTDRFAARLLFDACRLRGVDHLLRNHDEPAGESGEAMLNRFPVASFWARRTSIWLQLRELVETLLVAEDE